MRSLLIVISSLLLKVVAIDLSNANGSYDAALYTNNPEGVTIGLMKPFPEPPEIEKAVWFIEEDRTRNKHFIIADGSALKIFNYNFNPLRQRMIIGDSMSEGYREGEGTDARFNTITGFAQVNGTHILVADSKNHCLRYVVRHTELRFTSSSYAGLCGTSGFANGRPTDSRFNLPRQIAITQKKNSSIGVAFVTDFGNEAIRRVVIKDDSIETWVKLPIAPIAIILDFNEYWLYATTASQVWKIDPFKKEKSLVMQSSTTGFQDGHFEVAQIDSPTSIVEVTKFIYLIAEPTNNRLRVIDTKVKNVTSICNGNSAFSNSSANIENCELKQPLFIMTVRELVMIGTNGTEMRLLDFARRLEGRPPLVRRTQEMSKTTTAALPLAGKGTQAKDNSMVTTITVTVIGIIVVGAVVIASLAFYRFRNSKTSKPSERQAPATPDSITNKTGVHATLSTVSGVYEEIQDGYQSLNDTEIDFGYTCIELEKDQPPTKPRPARYSPLPSRPTQLVGSDKDQAPDYVDGEIALTRMKEIDSTEMTSNGYIEFNSKICSHEQIQM